MTGWKPVFRYPRAQDYRDAIKVLPMKNPRGFVPLSHQNKLASDTDALQSLHPTPEHEPPAADSQLAAGRSEHDLLHYPLCGETKTRPREQPNLEHLLRCFREA